MSPYITFKDFDSNGELQYYILQREYPHYCGVVAYLPIADSICQIPVTAHHLYITFAGTIRGNFALAHPQMEKEIYFIFHSMMLWFYQNRIVKDPKRYKKWLIHG